MASGVRNSPTLESGEVWHMNSVWTAESHLIRQWPVCRCCHSVQEYTVLHTNLAAWKAVHIQAHLPHVWDGTVQS